jgi:hypothetical protein
MENEPQKLKEYNIWRENNPVLSKIINMKIFELIKENKTAAIIIGAVIGLFMLKKFGGRRRVRRRRAPVVRVRVRRSARGSYNRIVKSGRNAGKKAWQIKGSPAARARMARLRRMRRSKVF